MKTLNIMFLRTREFEMVKGLEVENGEHGGEITHYFLLMIFYYSIN